MKQNRCITHPRQRTQPINREYRWDEPRSIILAPAASILLAPAAASMAPAAGAAAPDVAAVAAAAAVQAVLAAGAAPAAPGPAAGAASAPGVSERLRILELELELKQLKKQRLS